MAKTENNTQVEKQERTKSKLDFLKLKMDKRNKSQK